MKQIFAPYWDWEDYKSGMYDLVPVSSHSQLIEIAVDILSDPELFDLILIEVFKEWKVSIDVNLSNRSINRRAWLGRAACCYLYKVPEVLTRIAWKVLTDHQRIEADKIAIKYIQIYEKENIRLYSGTKKTRVSR